MRETTYAMAWSLKRGLKEMHDFRQRRIRISSANIKYSPNSGNMSLRRTRRKIAIILLTLTCFSMTQMKTPKNIKSIYRMLTHCDPDVSTSISFKKLRSMDLEMPTFADFPQIITRRDPSHIILCQALLQRIDNPAESQTPFSLIEDQSVCTDWSAPHASLIEIMASTVVGHVAAPHNVHYQHNCGNQDSVIVGGLDWTTIQQEFPVSSLVLDDNRINEGEVADLCKACIDGFEEVESNNAPNANGNPAWYDRTYTHHCILDPRPSTIDDPNFNAGVTTEDVNTAQQLVVSRVMPAIKDRVQLAAAEQKLESTETDGPQFVRSREEDDDDNGADVPNNEDEESDTSHSSEIIQDVVIYIERETLPLPDLLIDQYIPFQVTSINIHLHPYCAVNEGCVDYATKMQKYLDEAHASTEVTLDMISSTAEAYSNMVLAKVLLCFPGTTACLIPSMVKEEGTYAIVGESPHRPNTFRYFSFMPATDTQLQVAQIDVDERTFGRAFDDDYEDDDATSPPDHQLDSTDILVENMEEDAAKETFSSAGFREGCVNARGNLGSWEKDYSYESLKGDNAARIHGKTNNGDAAIDNTLSQSRYNQGLQMDIQKKSNPELAQRSSIFRSSDGTVGWKEKKPECELDLLNLVGLCEVVKVMKLSVLQFIGDEYTEDQVKQFLKEISLNNPTLAADIIEKTQSPTGLPDFRLTVTCPIDEKFPGEERKFDIAFTPNEKLVPTTDSDLNKSDRNQAGGQAGGPIEDTQPQPSQQEWYQNPYAQNSGYTVPMNYQPGYGNNCACVPFYDQYIQNQAVPVVSQPPPVATVPRAAPLPPKNQDQNPFIPRGKDRSIQYQYADPGQGSQPQPQPFQMQPRQIVMTGMSQKQTYDEFCRNHDQFGQTVNSVVNPNDIVFMRTAPPPHGSCGCQQCGRRTQEENSMTEKEIVMANDYMIQSIDHYRRNTRQTDLRNYSPITSQKPQIHVLDVSNMSRSHPHAKSSNPKNDHGRKLCQAQGWDTAPQVKWWNNMFYSNLRDMAAAEMARPQVQYQPQYSP